MAAACLQPIAFTRWPVTLTLVTTYVALFAALLTLSLAPPTAPPSTVKQQHGLDLDQAWLDLQHLSSCFHPYNSHSNDKVREWLLQRLHQIAHSRNASYDLVSSTPHAPLIRHSPNVTYPDLVIFDDLLSNTSLTSALGGTTSAYFEGTNLLVYVAGSEDDHSHWWDPKSRNHALRPHHGKQGVLVNAHYDSVSTGFGATDDGVAVVSILQLISHYLQPANKPKRGLLALFNNGEEDYLNGARAFAQHPFAVYPDTFLNLEGAGAGGRAALFRSTDAEVTYPYQSAPQPLGSSVFADGFRQGLVRSSTDYSVFNENLGMRGLDVAFTEPRWKYHTSKDSTVDTSKGSVWHMLSAALATTEALTSDVDTDFSSGKGVDVVYFDLLGSVLGVLPLLSYFAISVSLLVLGPLTVALVAYILSRNGKWYLFATSLKSDPLDPRAPDDETTVAIGGWRGFFRLPIAAGFAFAAVSALALLIDKVNPFITYSSPWPVWVLMLSVFLYILWFFLRGSDYMRPSALQRAHALGWIYLLSWMLLLGAAILADTRKLASGYPFMIYNASALVALLSAHLEFCALPKMDTYMRKVVYAQVEEQEHSSLHSGRISRASDHSRRHTRENSIEAVEPSETTSLLSQDRPSAWRGRRHHQPSSIIEREVDPIDSTTLPPHHGEEQGWSGALPRWTWLLQFLILGPLNIILLGQIGISLTIGLPQTIADGSPSFTLYILIALLSGLIMLPAGPFLHRITSRVPNFLFLVLAGCLLYSLLAFPFSPNARLKVFFEQQADLASGLTNTTLTGRAGYVQQLVASLPSAAGHTPHCTASPSQNRAELTTCSWPGLPAHVAPGNTSAWLSVRAARDKHTARIRVSGRATRACRLSFSAPVADFSVAGAAPADPRFPKVPAAGASELRLWSRTWGREWDVGVRWNATAAAASSIAGRAACLWSDQNAPGTIPALDEVRRFLPAWAIVTKLDDGLVRGFKEFTL